MLCKNQNSFFKESGMPTQYVISDVQNLKAVQVYYPLKNVSEAALLDVDKQVLIGLDKEPYIYHPVGGWSAVESIVESGLVPNSTIWGIECEHLYDDTYRLPRN
jgi:hypothetical protein